MPKNDGESVMDENKPELPQHDAGMNWIAVPGGHHVTAIPSVLALHNAWAAVVAWFEARVAELEGKPEPMPAPEPVPEVEAKSPEPFNPALATAVGENDGA